MRASPRLWFLRLVIFVSFGAVLVQSAYLQLVAGQVYREQADLNRFRLVSVPTSRGVIYDRSGALLVRNLPSFSVSLLPAYLPVDEEERVIARLSQLLEYPAESQVISRKELLLDFDQALLEPGEAITQPGLRDLIRAGRDAPFTPLVLARDVPREVAFIIQEDHLDLPGVLVQVEAIREYLSGPSTAHLLGYVGPIPQENLNHYLETGYEPWERVGLSGLELALEDELRGRLGRKYIEVDAGGREVRTVGSILPPQPGHNLILTIDLELQSKIVELLQRGMAAARSPSGVAIAMDPRTGEILAMVSLPQYDNNLLIQGVSRADFERLIQDPRRPLVNKAVSDQYPPGSLFKIVVAAAALQERVIDRSIRLNCPGTIWIPNEFRPDDPRLAQPFYDWLPSGHGWVNLPEAVAQSCDIFFYQVAGGYGDFAGLGDAQVESYARLFGLGEPSGIELPGESSGLVPDREWKRRNYGEPWVTGDTYNMAIGQGFILATPLQILNATAALANGGTLYRPQMVREVRDAQGHLVRPFQSQIIRRLPIDPKHLATIREGMRLAVLRGTGMRGGVEGIVVAGKTGSAEYPGPRDARGRLPTHAWFAAFAPAEKPEIAVMVFLEGGGEGSQRAAPVAAQILAYYFSRPLPTASIQGG